MPINLKFGATRILRQALTLVAASLTLNGAAFAQGNSDGSIPTAPSPGPGSYPGSIQTAPGVPGGPWGGGGGGRRHRMRQGMGQGQGMQPGMGQGQGGDPAKREARRQKMMKKFDANGDGQLDQNEMAQAKAFREQKRAQRQAQGGVGNPNSMGQGPMGGRRRGGIRGGRQRWQQNQQRMQPGQQPSMPDGMQQGQMPGQPMQPLQGADPNGLGQIQPFQNFPQGGPQN